MYTSMSIQGVVDEFWTAANPYSQCLEPTTEEEAERQARFESIDYYKPYPTMYMNHLRGGSVRARAPSSRNRYATTDPAHAAAVTVETPLTPGEEHLKNGVESNSVQGACETPPEQTFDAVTTRKSHDRNEALRWVLHVFIAVTVGVVAIIVSYSVELIQDHREHLLVRLMNKGGFGWCTLALFIDLCTSIWFVMIAAGVVVYFEPGAAGGGIPDVMAYLNGVHVPKVMTLRTFVVKSISCVCGVAGGLPVGLEAPLIHLGAIVGAGVTQGRSRALRCQTSLFQAFRNNKDRRDFITAGAACGVSAAFGAPIGGLLFVMEEVSSFWDHSASGQIFLATMVCFSIISIFRSVIEDQRLLGWVSNAVSVLFEVNLSIPLNVYSIAPSFFLGIVCGLFAALFTKVNIVLIKYRRRCMRQSSIRRFLEPVVAITLYSLLSYFFAMLSGCAPFQDMEDRGDVLVWGTENTTSLFTATCSENNTFSPLATLVLGSERDTIRHLFSRQTIWQYHPVQLLVLLLLYTIFACWSNGMAISGGLVVPSLVIGAALGRLFGLFVCFVGMGNIGVERGYMASLAWMDPGLFALIGAGAFLAGITRMTMSICVIMMELSSELHYLLPTMVAIIIAKAVAGLIAEPLYHQVLQLDSVPYLRACLMRPEFEQLTAADVMTSRVISLRQREKTSVVMQALQTTTHHAFPVVEAVRKKGAAVKGGEGVAPLPQLEEEMTELDNDDYTSYKFVGLVTREDLRIYLSLPQLSKLPAAPGESRERNGTSSRQPTAGVVEVNNVSWREWIAHKSSLFLANGGSNWLEPASPVLESEDECRSGSAFVSSTERSSEYSQINDACFPPVLDISLIVNRSPWVIPPFFNLEMVYQTFRMMGLRHMVVVDGDTVVGIITRKDLLVRVLDRRFEELQRGPFTNGNCHDRVAQQHGQATVTAINSCP
ncbi:chloride channel protein, putative [Trypanosoma brucei brucei TREU927]|uniref:Chloride channel protein n=1 Tax=Trypanosoma brucei brucei (strain 927/4 GUTat10.1) TaxID=185431 RepID=Q38EB7_TRYB2|nr:chloride channel protein, putative [Trypanosoma brucei brucei TREU927]EAN76853.1 chloride channel protein, putative [Trypanosoma brucei brucei TREU927]